MEVCTTFSATTAWTRTIGFPNRNGDPIPPLRRTTTGFTFGGPIFKNKTFFFVDYDGLRSSGLDTANGAVPTDLMRAGDFDTNGRCSVDAGQIWDPYSGTFDENAGGAVRTAFIPFNNIAAYTSPGSTNLPANLQPAPGVAGNLIDPVAQKLMSLFPEPTSTGDIYQNWFGSGSRRSYNDQFDVKIDHRFNESNLISGKFAYQYSHGKEPGLFQELR